MVPDPPGERIARDRDRVLLTATVAGGTGERFLDGSGFHRAGHAPGYTRGEDGTPTDSTLFWRTLASDAGE